MGSNATGILAYGYDVGDDLGYEYDRENPAWFQEEHGWQESAEIALLAAAGFTETDWQVDGYFARRSAAMAALGVQLRHHGDCDEPGFLLAAVVRTVDWGDVEPVDLTLPDNADGRLLWALEVLGITPKDDQPRWLLAAYWG